MLWVMVKMELFIFLERYVRITRNFNQTILNNKLKRLFLVNKKNMLFICMININSYVKNNHEIVKEKV